MVKCAGRQFPLLYVLNSMVVWGIKPTGIESECVCVCDRVGKHEREKEWWQDFEKQIRTFEEKKRGMKKSAERERVARCKERRNCACVECGGWERDETKEEELKKDEDEVPRRRSSRRRRMSRRRGVKGEMRKEIFFWFSAHCGLPLDQTEPRTIEGEGRSEEHRRRGQKRSPGRKRDALPVTMSGFRIRH